MKNTKITFTYRDSENYKNESGPYILEGELKAVELKDLEETFGEADSLLIPHQISKDFSNACPSQNGTATTHERAYDDSCDHPYHGLIVEETNEDVNCSMTINDFYKKVKDTEFDEFDY